MILEAAGLLASVRNSPLGIGSRVEVAASKSKLHAKRKQSCIGTSAIGYLK